MLIDCETCVARGAGCADCVVTVLLASPAPRARTDDHGRCEHGDHSEPGDHGEHVELDDSARAALEHLAAAGLVPPLRLVTPTSAPMHGSRDIA